MPERLEGMFAFAIWDARNGRLFLCRDRAGKKPLYMRVRPREMMFGSEVATLIHGLSAGMMPEVSPEAMLEFLTLGYTGLRSMFVGIEEVPPAHCVTVEKDGGRTMRPYWQPSQPQHSQPPGDLAASIREIIASAVRARLEADVPLGCFLSGGIDSSLVAALARAALTKQGLPPLRTFSVAMPQVDYDESPYAQAVAKHLGTQHTELVAAPGTPGTPGSPGTRGSGPGNNLLADLMQLTAASGEPLGDSSIIPTYWLSQATRQHVKVAAYRGDGGDGVLAATTVTGPCICWRGIGVGFSTSRQ